jgi:hypothetical protein
MEINKVSILAMVPDFLLSLNDSSFKSLLLEARKSPEVIEDPMAMMTLILPKLSEILKKNGFVEPNAPQQFFMFIFMNQNDPDIKALSDKLQKALLA